MNELDIDVNQFPSLTWNFLNINRTHLKFPSGVKAAAPDSAAVLVPSGPEIGIQTGLGKEFDLQFDSLLKDSGIATGLYTASGKGQVQKFEFTAGNGEVSAADIVIHAEENADVSCIFVYKSGQEVLDAAFGIRIRVKAEENARVHVATVNMLGKDVLHFNSIGCECADNAVVEVTELELGGKNSYSGTFCCLEGYKSRFLGRAAYVVLENSFLDMNQAVIQRGINTESRFFVDGVLSGSAGKTWRGTIEFKRGCRDSVGDEQEDVLLLSPDCVNKSLPVILCDEEAVEGRHGCSIGKLDMEKLFYMQSRGVDEKTARKLLTKAKVSKVLRFIPDAGLAEQITGFVENLV